MSTTPSLTGIFGGAFDPVHRDHVRLMRLALSQMGLTRLVLLPSAAAPHKTTDTPYTHRVAMLRLATADMPVIIDESERTWQGKAYSSDILPVMQAKYGPIVHIIGGDSLCDMPTWHEPRSVMHFAHAVVSRGAPDQALLRALRFAQTEYGADITLLQQHAGTYSSSAIRLAYRIGSIPYVQGPIGQEAASAYGVQPAVHDYLVSQRLYHEYASIVEQVPRAISPSRWAHTQQVACMAVRLNKQLHLDENKVILAALLHDCAKGLTTLHTGVPQEVADYPAVVHAFNGAQEAAIRYGVTDPEVLDAIRYHTTGRPAMSDLERLIYLADMVEDTRTFDGADALRALALADFGQGFLAAVRTTHDHLLHSDKKAHPLGEACYQYYIRSQL